MNGRFSLRGRGQGLHTLAAENFGYAIEVQDVRLAADPTQVVIRLRPAPLQLDEVRVRPDVRRVRHELSYAGFYARAAESPSVGSNRVILRTDPEFDVVMTVRDLLYNFRPGQCAPIILWHGFRIGRMPPREYLDTPATAVEGIEYYRSLASMPLALRHEVLEQPSRVRRCGVLVIWPRRS